MRFSPFPRGVPVRTVSLAELATTRSNSFRVGHNLYAIADGTLFREVEGTWTLIEIERVSSFISQKNSQTIIVLVEDEQRACVFDELREVP